MKKKQKEEIKKIATSALLTGVITLSTSCSNEKEVNININNVIPLEVSENLEENKIDEYINYYSNIYGLNSDKVRNIIYENLNIEDNKNIQEIEIMLYIRDIFLNSNNYGYELDYLKEDEIIESELDIERQIFKISEILGVDGTLNYSIICYQTEIFNTENFLKYNNPSNFQYNNAVMVFPTVYAGFIEQSLVLLQHNLNGRYTVEQIINNTESILDKGMWINTINEMIIILGDIGKTIYEYDYKAKFDEVNDFLRKNCDFGLSGVEIGTYIAGQFDYFNHSALSWINNLNEDKEHKEHKRK